MSDVPFVAQLRTRPTMVRLGPPQAEVETVRVQLAETWDAIRVDAPLSEPVVALKVATLAVLEPEAQFHEDYVLKLRGFEVLDEQASLADVGAVNGSIFLLQHRRRRPVR